MTTLRLRAPDEHIHQVPWAVPRALCGVPIIGAGASKPRPELLIPDGVRHSSKQSK